MKASRLSLQQRPSIASKSTRFQNVCIRQPEVSANKTLVTFSSAVVISKHGLRTFHTLQSRTALQHVLSVRRSSSRPAFQLLPAVGRSGSGRVAAAAVRHRLQEFSDAFTNQKQWKIVLGQALELETLSAKFDCMQKDLVSTQDSVALSDEKTDTETEALGEEIDSDTKLRTSSDSRRVTVTGTAAVRDRLEEFSDAFTNKKQWNIVIGQALELAILSAN